MVLLLEKFFHPLKLSSSTIENRHHHHRHQSEALSASLQSFRYDVSSCLNKLSLNLKPGSESISLSWIHQCLELLSNLNRAFAKLVMEIDYPMSKWDLPSIEEYLNYSLKLLDLLNSISSSLSHLGRARISISLSLSLIDESPESAVDQLKAVKLMTNLNKEMEVEEMEEEREGKKGVYYGKNWVFHQALMGVKRNGYWVCGIVLLGLSGHIRPCLEMEKLGRGFIISPSPMGMEKMWVAKEVREVKDGVDSLVAAVAAGGSGGAAAAREELERRLEVVEKVLDVIGKEADGLFSEILAGRIELLGSLRQMKP